MSIKNRTEPIIDSGRACQFARLLDRVRPAAHHPAPTQSPPARPMTGLSAWVTSTALTAALYEALEILSSHLGEHADIVNIDELRSRDGRNAALRAARVIDALEVIGWPHEHYVEGMEYTTMPSAARAPFAWTPEGRA